EILAFCLDTKSYVLLEHECQYKVPWCDVAPSGANFLSGMLVMIDYWSKSGVNLIDMDDEITGVEYRSKCVEALGGSKYEGFGTSLFGW
ncbi:MAG: hypothetical protein KDA65_14410, partial [Planctomycetaceae bacterium]|nr:hypothetical protein [Planctomycetaceae bacterium]